MTFRDLRIVFAGTPEFAAVHLNSLIQADCQIVSTYSQPDRPTGRGKKIQPTPVKSVALASGIVVEQPLNLRSGEAAAQLAEVAPDLMIVVAYGLMLPKAILDIPRLGCINVHASLLPRWRGAAPIERSLLAGDLESGVSIMQMESGLDTGPVLAMASIPITDDDTSGSLTLKLQTLGCTTLLNVLEGLAQGSVHAIPQDNSAATYAHKLRKDEAGIIWTASAGNIHRQIRAFYPRSPAYCFYQGERLRIISAKAANHHNTGSIPGTIVRVEHDKVLVVCGEGSLEISEVQLEGKTPMALSALLNGHPGYFKPGSQLLSVITHDQDIK